MVVWGSSIQEWPVEGAVFAGRPTFWHGIPKSAREKRPITPQKA